MLIVWLLEEKVKLKVPILQFCGVTSDNLTEFLTILNFSHCLFLKVMKSIRAVKELAMLGQTPAKSKTSRRVLWELEGH